MIEDVIEGLDVERGGGHCVYIFEPHTTNPNRGIPLLNLDSTRMVVLANRAGFCHLTPYLIIN